MLETFLATLSPMLVLFICIIIGFILKKKQLLPDNADTVISKLENYICVPALVLSTFMTYCNVTSLKEQGISIIYSIAGLVIAMVIALTISRFFAKDDLYLRNIYKYGFTFSNHGFMGNAIVPAILGAADPQILYKYLLFTLPLQVVVYTWGIMILVVRKDEKSNPVKNLINPIFIAMLIGIVIGITGTNKYIPDFVMTVIDYCKACMAPLAMILTGFVIGGYSIKNLLSGKKVYIATALRLFVLPAIVLLVLKLLGASEVVLTLALFAYATPFGLNTVVFPAAYGQDTHPGASMAMISTTLSIVTIPIMYTLAKMFLL